MLILRYSFASIDLSIVFLSIEYLAALEYLEISDSITARISDEGVVIRGLPQHQQIICFF